MIGGGKREERGRKWGMRGREVGIEGAGSGDRDGRKRGSSTPLSTPTLWEGVTKACIYGVGHMTKMHMVTMPIYDEKLEKTSPEPKV